MMWNRVISLLAGLLFGAGLTLSQMVDPNKVLAFLDVAGAWDPSLAWVMAAALMVFGSGYHLLIKPRLQQQQAPLCSARYELPTKVAIDRPLLVGAVLFGIGWGLAGICPGPAIANLSGDSVKIVIFIVAMLVGMGLVNAWTARAR